MATGRYQKALWGGDEIVRVAAGSGPSTVTLTTLNNGYAARFTALNTKDIKGVYLNFSSGSGTARFDLRIETIDATTGKPSGTPYDASAVLTGQTPVSGWSLYQFASLPTAGLAAGTEYAVVVLCTTGGTNQTLRGYVSVGSYPTVALTAADGTTRANFAEVALSAPVCTFLLEDDTEDALNCCPFINNGNAAVYGTNAGGLKFTVPANVTLSLAGVEVAYVGRGGSPENLRVRILTSADAAVSGASRTVDKDSLTGLSSRRLRVLFDSPVSLAGGASGATYRAVLDQTDHTTTSGNVYNVVRAAARSSSLVPQGFILTSTTNIDAGTITWTDTATEQPALALILDDVPDVASGGGGGTVIGSPVVRGLGRVA